MNYTPEHFMQVSRKLQESRAEIAKFIVGQKEAVDFLLYGVLADGHVLLEGLPGLGKTMLVRTLAEVLDLSFARIQFTPDLMPADITGTTMIERDENGGQRFIFRKGPIFHQMVLADEINRATPKTQSALLEAMGEKTVTVLGETKQVSEPFFVLATQNPIEMEGTYPLPEAQVDRFLCKVVMEYPSREELAEISRRTTGSGSQPLTKIMTAAEVTEAQQMLKQVLIADDLLLLAVDMVRSTSPDSSPDETIRKFVAYGSGPRGLQSLIRLAKARAMTEGRFHVSIADLKYAVLPALRHRLILNYEGSAEGVEVDELIARAVRVAEKSPV
ncbi:AAA family ATPase [Indiicoccus explosivorum]|uniref:AAA family ATPase n=1 Tax=Indiicoccus explosivorum TaxID=1917864 RepID=UPI001588260A|nr:AAA family ATPase [Indiicoccus explosivorum]